ncbi:MAG: LON peptidase substrate-binding domain-containing protein, partial [Verrucomicrobiaceae bacterium]|nr:LON peptidase substrate-binding domain-containing protein [Verrucomicrobiaceae bacterium]
MTDGEIVQSLLAGGEPIESRVSDDTSRAAGDKATPRIPEELSILPMREFVVFPGTVVPLTVGRASSIKLLDETLPLTKVIGLLTQRNPETEDPQPQDLYPIGTAALVLKLLRQSDERIVMIVQGLQRFSLRKFIVTSPYL